MLHEYMNAMVHPCLRAANTRYPTDCGALRAPPALFQCASSAPTFSTFSSPQIVSIKPRNSFSDAASA